MGCRAVHVGRLVGVDRTLGRYMKIGHLSLRFLHVYSLYEDMGSGKKG